MHKHWILFSTCTVLLFLCEIIGADELQCPNDLKATSTLRKLKKDILCGYDTSLRPVRQHNESVNVRLRLVIRRLDFDDKMDKLTIHSWFGVIWRDYHLVWDPAKYDKVDNIILINYYIWNPDVGIYTSVEEIAYPYMKYAKCWISYNGFVTCMPSVDHVTSCSADLTRWPYDTHTCSMTMGSWTHSGEQVNIFLAEDPIQFNDYNENREWNLISTNSYRHTGKYDCCPNDTYPSINIEFVIQRRSGFYAATIIIPAVVLMIMILATFWMDVDHSDRVILAEVLVFFHFLFLQYLGVLLPSNGNKTPLIITFCRDSMFLATVALLIAIMVRNLKSSSRHLPLWASGVTSWIVQNRLGQFLVPSNMTSKDVAVESQEPGEENSAVESAIIGAPMSSWDTFTIIFDLVGFIVTLFVYFILLLGFIP